MKSYVHLNCPSKKVMRQVSMKTMICSACEQKVSGENIYHTLDPKPKVAEHALEINKIPYEIYFRQDTARDNTS